MENHTYLLAACLANRQAHAVIDGTLAPKASETVRGILRAVTEYYQRDPEAQWVTPSVLCAIIEGNAARKETAAAMVEMVKALPSRDKLEVSAQNVAHAVQVAQVREIRMRLAAALENNQDVDQLMEELKAAQAPTLERNKTQYTLADLIQVASDRTPLHPAALTKAFSGGLGAGHAGVVFGRPGAGKTLVTVNMGVSYIRYMDQATKKPAPKTVLHIGNEESGEQLQNRYLSLLMCAAGPERSGYGRLENMAHQDQAMREKSLKESMGFCTDMGWLKHLHIVHGVYSYREVEALVADIGPDLVVLDQLRHFRVGQADAPLHDRLESNMQRFRQHAHDAGFAGAAVTQAGASGDGKEVLEEVDIDGAKTGFQGAADFIIGLGVTPILKANNQRVISICRNKVSGKILSFPVWVDEQHTLIKNTQ